MAFEGLSEKLSAAFKKLRGKGRLSEADVKEAMREIRLALLEADVSFKVVKQFVAQVTEKAVGADVLEALSPAQQIIKIVNQFAPAHHFTRQSIQLIRIFFQPLKQLPPVLISGYGKREKSLPQFARNQDVIFRIFIGDQQNQRLKNLFDHPMILFV